MGGRWLIRYIFKHLKFNRPQPILNFHWLLNQYLLFSLNVLFIFNWRMLALQHCVGLCHTSAWISHRSIYVPCGSAGKKSSCYEGELGSVPGLGRSPGEEKGYPLQYSGLENSMDCIVHGVAKSRTQPSNFHFTHPWTSLPPPTPSHPFRLSQSTGF